MTTVKYETKEEDRSQEGVKYLFTSKGNNPVIKAVHYEYIMNLKELSVYNLGFGDYKDDTIDDNVNTENGDVYKVFNTVLSTIPKFFELFQNAIIFVMGSDSSPNFVEKCKITCKKKCTSFCKNQHRRIKAYRYYVDKNFDVLRKDYRFLGGILNSTNQTNIEEYIPHRIYHSVWVMKNKM